MSLFSLGRKKNRDEPEEKKQKGVQNVSLESTPAKAEQASAKTEHAGDSPRSSGGSYVGEVLIRPIFTEKAVGMEATHKYVFQVDPRSNKSEVAKAVERAYGVSVEKVAIVNKRAKVRRWRGRVGTASGMKKAIVTLAKGEAIEVVSH